MPPKVPNRNECRHFNGIFPLKKDRTCEAGVKYLKINPNPLKPNWLAKLPCLLNNESPLPCKKLEPFTEEELRKESLDWNTLFEATTTVVGQIKRKHLGERDVRGTVQCPLCKEPLHYHIERSRGHIHAKCSTKGCLMFME